MINSERELVERGARIQRRLSAGAREETLMRRAVSTLFLARRAVLQKLAGEIDAEPNENVENLAQQVITLTQSIEVTNELRRGIRNDPSHWGNQLDELEVPYYGEAREPEAV